MADYMRSGGSRFLSGSVGGIVFKTVRVALGLAIVLSVVFATDPDGWRFLDDRIMALVSDPGVEPLKVGGLYLRRES